MNKCPSCGFELNGKKTKCKAVVDTRWATEKRGPCAFAAIADGYCKRHHPDQKIKQKEKWVKELRELIQKGTYLLDRLGKE
jgi:hypothetical protein